MWVIDSPTRAKAVFKEIDNQFANPVNVPGKGPILLSIKKYDPPDLGMAVVSSIFERIDGSMNIQAKK